METLHYTITFLSDWHASSGLSGGVAADSLIIKDKNQLPFLPGKTVKGLLKDALQEICDVQPNKCSEQEIKDLFGIGENTEGTKSHFTNAYMPIAERHEIVSNNLQPYLYRNISSTAIEESGIAKDKSLRAMEVCLPLELEGEVQNITERDIELLKMAFKWTRRLGMKRNRGFGRCIFQLKKDKL